MTASIDTALLRRRGQIHTVVGVILAQFDVPSLEASPRRRAERRKNSEAPPQQFAVRRYWTILRRVASRASSLLPQNENLAVICSKRELELNT